MSSPPDSVDWPCPATPEWTVHDVVAHLRGVCEDVRTGNMDGVTTDPWTAAQVFRHRHTSMAALLDGWNADAALLEGFLSTPTGQSSFRAVFDVATHEADLRGALGRTAPLTSELGDFVVPLLATGMVDAVRDAGLPPLRIETDEGDTIGATTATTTLRISRFEFFRARFGRRSAAQAAAYDWGVADPAAYLPHLFIFGPRSEDLIETIRV